MFESMTRCWEKQGGRGESKLWSMNGITSSFITDLLAKEKEVLTQVTQLTLSKFGLGVFGLTLYSPIFISEMESVWCVGFNRISYVSCMFREVYYTKTVFYLLTSWLRAASHPLTGLAPLGPLKKYPNFQKKNMLKRCRKRCRKRIPLRPWPYMGEVVFF